MNADGSITIAVNADDKQAQAKLASLEKKIENLGKSIQDMGSKGHRLFSK